MDQPIYDKFGNISNFKTPSFYKESIGLSGEFQDLKKKLAHVCCLLLQP